MTFMKKQYLNSHFLRIAASVLLLVVLFFQNVGNGLGASSWTTPAVLSPTGSFAWFPDILADQFGRVHVVWAAGSVGFDQVFYTYSEDGLKWQQPNDIFAIPLLDSSSAATRPTLQIDGNGHLNVTFVDLTTVFYSKAALENTLTANLWQPRMAMSRGQTAYFSRLAVDSKNTLHFVFTQNTPSEECLFCYHLYYRQSTDDGATWSTPVDLIKDANGAVKPQILIDAEDHINVVWETGKGGGLGQLSNPTSVSYAGSTDGGKTWSTPENLSAGYSTMGKNIAIGTDKIGNLVVAWWALPANKIQYQISSNSGRNWSAPAPIPGVWGAGGVYLSNLDDYAFANDGDGNLHLVAVGTLAAEQTSLNILNLKWDGARWTPPDVVATYKGDVPEWPRVSIGQGNQMNVIWFVRDEPHIWISDKGEYRVWYSKTQLDSAYIAPLQLPTVTPIVVLTPTVKASLAPTIGPTQTAANLPVRAPGGGPQTETDFVLLLALAIVPSVIVIGGMAIYMTTRRR